MIVASVVVALTVGILLTVAGVAFLIVGSLSSTVTGYGKTILESGRVFLWTGTFLLSFLILMLLLDISGIF